MSDSDELDALKRRGRRRLVGAIALVVLAAIVLPMVLENEPKQPSPPAVSIRIPAEDGSVFVPKPAPLPAPVAQSPAVEEVAPGKSESARQQPPGARPGEPPTADKAGAGERAGAAASEPARTASAASAQGPQASPARAGEGGVQYLVPVAALASAERLSELTARLKAARIPHVAEPVATASGPVTRVRAGPFATREAAERAQAELRRMGLKPGAIVARP